MIEDTTSARAVIQGTYQTQITQKYTKFLSQFPEIFYDLKNGSIFDFAIYESIESYDKGIVIDVFNVLRNKNGIEINPGHADDPDLELSLSINAVKDLIKTKSKKEYAKLLGSFYNDPDEKIGWIDFTLHKRTQILINMGYGKFAQAAGILEEDDEIYTF